jgi:hypothetical protein
MYANLCLNQRTNKWIYFRDTEEDFVPKIPESYLHHDHSRPSADPKPAQARGLIQSDFAVSLSPLGQLYNAYNWAYAEGTNENGWKQGTFGAGHRWAPDVVDGQIPAGHTMMGADRLYVLYQAYIAHNIGHLIFDEFLPWFTLQRMFGLDTTQQIQPLSYIRDMQWPAEESCHWYGTIITHSIPIGTVQYYPTSHASYQHHMYHTNITCIIPTLHVSYQHHMYHTNITCI